MKSDVTNCDDLADYHWLIGAEAADWLAQITESGEPVHTWAARLRHKLSAAHTHLLLEQVDLRRRAAVKFKAADRMFFTRRLLEQATDQWVAEYKASRLADSRDIADLCCGIGGDLLSFLQRSAVTVLDRDPIAICLAQANVAATLGGPPAGRVEFRLADVTRWQPSRSATWHLDPDRRSGGLRSSQPEFASPALAEINRLLSTAPHAAIKLAPAARVPEKWAEDCELEWISRRGQCKQLVAWHGKLAEATGLRRATIVQPGTQRDNQDVEVVATVTGKPSRPAAVAARLSRYLFEPDAAVLAAKLTGELAAKHDLRAVSVGSVYLTADRPVDDRCLSCFEIHDILANDRRALTAYFAARDIGRLEIKKRGVDLDPARLRSDLKLRGENHATLIVTRIACKTCAIIAQRVRRDST